jgi:hypothetical protein
VHTFVALRFSAFGRLATVWSSTDQVRKGPKESDAIEAVLRQHGYSFVPIAALDEMYDGCCRFGDRIETWWERFFGYP